MTLVPAKTTPCKVPPDFDQDIYGAVSALMSPFSHTPPWSSYASGFNGLPFRFAAADDAHERLVTALSDPKALGPSGPRYVQEEALFAFYVNTVSAVECLYFGLYNLAASVGANEFRTDTPTALRQISIGSTAKTFAKAFPKRRLTAEVTRVAASRQLQALKEFRDYLAHRGTTPRMHTVMMGPDRRVNMSDVLSATTTINPKDLPSSWRSTLELTPSMTAKPRAWLGITVAELLRATHRFLVERQALQAK